MLKETILGVPNEIIQEEDEKTQAYSKGWKAGYDKALETNCGFRLSQNKRGLIILEYGLCETELSLRQIIDLSINLSVIGFNKEKFRMIYDSHRQMDYLENL